jgi:hypothetical protein
VALGNGWSHTPIWTAGNSWVMNSSRAMHSSGHQTTTTIQSSALRSTPTLGTSLNLSSSLQEPLVQVEPSLRFNSASYRALPLLISLKLIPLLHLLDLGVHLHSFRQFSQITHDRQCPPLVMRPWSVTEPDRSPKLKIHPLV